MPDVLHPAWLPEKTFFNKPVPKNKFYEKLDVKPALKKVFVNQIEKIVWRNKLAPATLNVQPGTRVQELLVFEITLKTRPLDEAALKLIDKGIPYHILFLLKHDDLYMVCMGYKDLSDKTISQYFKTDWMPLDELPLQTSGVTLDDVYDGYIKQINSRLDTDSATPLKDVIRNDAQRAKIERQIARLEAQMRTEKQPRRKFELAQTIQKLKTDLEE
jgi:hypothetical protein